MALSLRVAARVWIFKLGLVVLLYSGFSVSFFQVFSSRSSGVARQPVTFRDSLRSPYGTPCRRAANNAVLVQRKVTKRKHTI